MSAGREKPILLLGGRGKTGGRVARLLETMGKAVRLGSRTGTPPFSWDDRPGWEAVLDGVSAVYITYYPDLSVPGAAEAVGAFSRLAVSLGVRRLVLLSGRGEPEALRSEEHLKASGADWTIVRSAWFNQNFSESIMQDQVMSGTVALPVGDVGEPFIDADDIAEIVVAALTEDRHIGQLYEVTGPRLLTFAEAVRIIAQAAGRRIDYVQISHDEFAEAIVHENLPDDIAWLLNELFTVVLDGRNEYLSDGVRRALGREPRDFSEYAKAAAASGAWSLGDEQKTMGA